MFSQLSVQMVNTRQREIEAKAARAHHVEVLRDPPVRDAAPRRRWSLRLPSVALLGSLVARRA